MRFIKFYYAPQNRNFFAAIIAIISNIAAGYIADAFIPSYRRIFLQQTQTLIMGWKDILTINTYKK